MIPIKNARLALCPIGGFSWSSVAAAVVHHTFALAKLESQAGRQARLHSAVSERRVSGSRKHLGAEAFAGRHHRKDDPGKLVGQCHRHAPRGLPRQQSGDKVAQRALAFA